MLPIVEALCHLYDELLIVHGLLELARPLGLIRALHAVMLRLLEGGRCGLVFKLLSLGVFERLELTLRRGWLERERSNRVDVAQGAMLVREDPLAALVDDRPDPLLRLVDIY